jgi:hypothetical protein
MTRTGPSAAMLTLIAPASPGTSITASVTAQPSGWYALRVQIGPAVRILLVSSGGGIRLR